MSFYTSLKYKRPPFKAASYRFYLIPSQKSIMINNPNTTSNPIKLVSIILQDSPYLHI